MASRRFKVALSFPGEHRAFVKDVADILIGKLGEDSVFYDFYFEDELARPDLDVYLMEIYKDHSELVAIFFCEEYEKKKWCGLEWRAIKTLIFEKRAQEIMPFKFSDFSMRGFFAIDGYVDIKGRSPQVIADLILKRLKKNAQEIKDTSTAAPSILDEPTPEIVLQPAVDQSGADIAKKQKQGIKIFLIAAIIVPLITLMWYFLNKPAQDTNDTSLGTTDSSLGVTGRKDTIAKAYRDGPYKFMISGNLPDAKAGLKQLADKFPDTGLATIINRMNDFFRMWKMNSGRAWALRKNGQLCIVDSTFQTIKLAKELLVSAWTGTGNWVCISAKGDNFLFNANHVRPNYSYELYDLDEIILFQNNFFVKRGGKWKLLNEQEVQLASTAFDAVDPGDRLANTYSACNGKNDKIVRTTGDPELACVQVGKALGVVNNQGTYVLQPQYAQISMNDEWVWQIADGRPRMISVKSNDKWGAYNRKGKLIIPIQYDKVECGLKVCMVKDGNKIGFINQEGITVIPFNYSKVDIDNKGKATLVSTDGATSTIDLKSLSQEN